MVTTGLEWRLATPMVSIIGPATDNDLAACRGGRCGCGAALRPAERLLEVGPEIRRCLTTNAQPEESGWEVRLTGVTTAALDQRLDPPRLVAWRMIRSAAHRICRFGIRQIEADHGAEAGIPNVLHTGMGVKAVDKVARFRACSSRMAIVRRPRKARKVSKAPGLAPSKVRPVRSCSRSEVAGGEDTPRRSLWPPIIFVVDCMQCRAEFEGLLPQCGSEGVVHGEKTARSPRRSTNGSKISHGEKWVGRRFGPDDASAGVNPRRYRPYQVARGSSVRAPSWAIWATPW